MKIFIGSSLKHICIAQEIAVMIEKCGHKPILWTEWFEPSDFTFILISRNNYTHVEPKGGRNH